jgi:hypothetical protein
MEFRSPKFIWALVYSYTQLLIGLELATPTPPFPHLNSYTRALLVTGQPRKTTSLSTPYLLQSAVNAFQPE